MHTHIRLLALAAMAACGGAQAQSSEHTVKLGFIRYAPDSRSNGITGIGIPAGADATVGSANTVIATYEYHFADNWGVEAVVGIPPTVRTRATGSVAYLGEVLSARNVSPTAFIVYHFNAPGSEWRPYLGAGVNYTRFADAKSPYAFDIKLGDTKGFAFQAGTDWKIDNNWGLFASIARVNSRTKLVAVGATVLQTTIDLRPTTYSFGALYRF